MFWATCSFGYFGFLHTSEFTVPSLASFSPSYHLGVQDIAVDSLSAPSCMSLRIKGSKTDPFRKGAFIHIGLGQPPFCTVHTVLSFLTHRGDISGPLFPFQNGQPLLCALLTDWLRQILASVNIPSNFSSHSFRIGAATVAARNGVPDHLIQALGHWSSSAYQLYIRTPSKSLTALFIKLAQQSSFGQQRHLPALAPVQPEHCISALVFPSARSLFYCFFSSSLCRSHQFPFGATSTSAGSGLPDHQATVRPFVQRGIPAPQPDALHSSSDI